VTSATGSFGFHPVRGVGTWRLHAPALVRYERSNERFSALAQLASAPVGYRPSPPQW
jgi:hypothetical protein